jgi:hypothetical protein
MRNLPTRDEAAPYLDLGFEMVPDGDGEERLRLLLARGGWSWGFGEAETDPKRIAENRAAAEEAVSMARQMGRGDLLSAALDSRGSTSYLVGGYGLAQKDQAERLGLVPGLQDQTEVIDIYSTSAWAAAHIGEFRRAAELASRGLELANSLGVSNSGPSAFLGVSRYRLGDWEAFWSTFAAAEVLIDPAKPLRYHSFRLYGIAAYLHEVAGDRGAADRLIERIDESQAVQGQVGVSGARLWIVMTLIRRGAFGDARRRLAVEDPVRGIQNRDLDLEARADLVAAEGAWVQAATIVAETRDWADRTGLLFLPSVADRLEGQAA